MSNFLRNLSAKELASWSLLGAIRAAASPKANSLERELSNQICAERTASDPHWASPGENFVSVPLDLAFRHTATRATSGMVPPSTGQHLTPQQDGPFQAFLTDQLALGKLGATFLFNLTGGCKVAGCEVLGDGRLYDEVAESTTEDEVEFRGTVMRPRRILSKSSCSRQLYNNSDNPTVVQAFERAHAVRVANTLEDRVLNGTGGDEDLTGVFQSDDVTRLTFEEITALNLSSMQKQVIDQKALVGPTGFLMGADSLHYGENVRRYETGDRTIIEATGDHAWRFNGSPVCLSNKAPENLPTGDSPSDLSLHGVAYGAWSALVVGFFGRATLDILVNPIELAAVGALTIYTFMYVDSALLLPEAIVTAGVDPTL